MFNFIKFFKKEIFMYLKENNLELGDTQIIDPAKSDKTSEYAKELYELRKAKGMTEEQAQKLILEPIYYGMMMVKLNHADGLVSGAAHSTADTLRPALQILKTAPGTKLVSAFFVMVVPNCEYGANGTFIFADSGLNEEPDAEKLSEIAISYISTLAFSMRSRFGYSLTMDTRFCFVYQLSQSMITFFVMKIQA